MISRLETFMRIINIPGNKMAFHDKISIFFDKSEVAGWQVGLQSLP
jgi:hypothetical protein